MQACSCILPLSRKNKQKKETTDALWNGTVILIEILLSSLRTAVVLQEIISNKSCHSIAVAKVIMPVAFAHSGWVPCAQGRAGETCSTPTAQPKPVLPLCCSLQDCDGSFTTKVKKWMTPITFNSFGHFCLNVTHYIPSYKRIPAGLWIRVTYLCPTEELHRCFWMKAEFASKYSFQF